MSEFVKLCGLWKNKTKDGKAMMTGYLGGAKVLILPNKEKVEGDPKSHDYILFVTAAPPRDKKPTNGSQAQGSSQGAPPPGDEDAPF